MSGEFKADTIERLRKENDELRAKLQQCDPVAEAEKKALAGELKASEGECVELRKKVRELRAENATLAGSEIAKALEEAKAENIRLAADLVSSVDEGGRLAREILQLKGLKDEPEQVDDRKAANELARIRNYLFREWAGLVVKDGESSGTADTAIRILRRARASKLRAKLGEEEDGLAWAEEQISTLSKYLLDEWTEELGDSDDLKSPAEAAIELLGRLDKAVDLKVDCLERSKSSGNKYHRGIVPLGGYKTPHVDVYRVLYAFNVVRPGLQHAIKKLLCAGIRGKGSPEQDLREAIDAIVAELDYIRARGGLTPGYNWRELMP